ncbi:BsuPI-related putative proteinase inhibitor [Salimicrobium halophilum]|uniref:Immunoglobulin-like domain of spore germination n=1 Tax=Salimicrobium halophilum TaxID=86666 RepID=A0A1G8TRP6_9BACI|nr:BsuPI-related putative proteinase inhibitor [Salimicrobium halophilum]SDJ44201.1 Immunoglobulin-like domain of spore germination [Salimicrobium halophilum]
MRKWFLSILMLALVVLAACGSSEDTETGSESQDENQEESTDVEALAEQLTLNSEVETDNQEASIRFSLTNEGEEAVELGFASGQQFDVHIADENGENVYTYSANRSFTQEQSTKELDADAVMENAVQWDENVEPGEYEATVTFLIDTINGEDVGDREFESTSMFTIEEAEETSSDEGTEGSTTDDAGDDSSSNEGDSDEGPSSENSSEGEETTSIDGNDAFRNLELSGENGNYTISGEARVFEGSFLYRVEDGHNELIGETPVQVDSGAPSWSEFSLDISIPESDLPDFGTLTLMLYENSAKDGEPTNVNYVPLEQFNGE